MPEMRKQGKPTKNGKNTEIVRIRATFLRMISAACVIDIKRRLIKNNRKKNV